MAQKSKVVDNPPAALVDLTQLPNVMQNVMKQAATDSAPALNIFSEFQQRRATRLKNTAKVLRTKLGKDDLTVATAENMSQSLDVLKTDLSAQTARLQNFPILNPNEWIVFGTVLDAQGKGVGGLAVRVFDRERKYDELLGGTETDKNGDFFVIYQELIFKKAGESLPELYLMVADASGKTVYSSADSILHKAGQSEYFAISLDAPTPKVRRKKAA